MGTVNLVTPHNTVNNFSLVSKISPVSPKTTRVFIYNDPSLQSHYLLTEPITVTGDISIEYVTSTATTEMDFANGFGITSSGLFKAPASVTDIELNGVSAGLDCAAPLDGKLNHVKFVGVSDGVITTVGQSGIGTNYFKGILANFKITDVLSGDPVVTTFKLGERTGNTEQSVENSSALTYTNVPDSNRETYELSGAQWGNTGTKTQAFPATIDAAEWS